MDLRPAKAHEKLPWRLHRHPRAPPGLTRLAWISGAFCRKFAASPVCPRVRSPLPAVVFPLCPRFASALPAIIPPQEELYRDAAMDSRSRVGPTGQPRPDPGPTQRPATLGGYLGHGTNARPAGPGEAARDTGGSD